MKSMKGRFLKKLNCIPSIGSLKPGLVYHLNSTENLSYKNLQVPPIYIQEDHKKGILAECLPWIVLRLQSQRTSPWSKPQKTEAGKETEEHPSLSDFEEKCLPGGSQSVILYTTGLRSIRKTFEDCHAIREELWRILGGRVIPPRLFIRGRYIGGADEVISLHEQGRLKKLLAGIPLNLSDSPCNGCGNKRFVVCSNCNGSCKVFEEDQNDEKCIICPECNENGLAKCPICS
ncbi:hypothetical protein OIU78_002367 [Salix suchowensis]|nr:hypothetical protein OIU78_002367 [Salix suchowensis]